MCLVQCSIREPSNVSLNLWIGSNDHKTATHSIAVVCGLVSDRCWQTLSYCMKFDFVRQLEYIQVHIYPYKPLLFTLVKAHRYWRTCWSSHICLKASLNRNPIFPFCAWYSDHILGMTRKEAVLIYLIWSPPQSWPHIHNSPPFGHRHRVVMLQVCVGASREGRWETHMCQICHD